MQFQVNIYKTGVWISINIIRDLPILCNVKWEEPRRNEVGINGSEAVGRRKEGWDIVSNSLLYGIPHISLDNP